MDEPTNDLDIETLELLEELLLNFTGTLLLVSHDRTFMDNVVTSVLAMQGDGVIGDYVGGYSDWERQRPAPRQQTNQDAASPAPAPKEKTTPRSLQKPKKKLGYREQQELNRLPEKIDALEDRQAKLTALVSDADFYQKPQDTITATLQELDQTTKELDHCYTRWAELED